MNVRIPRPWLVAAVCAATLAAAPLTAQIGGQETVKKILDDVDEQMQEIDRLLLESARAEEGGGAPPTEAVREKVQRSRESQERVVRGIDKLLDELQRMAQQSQSSGGSSSDQQQRDQQGRQQGEQPRRQPGEREQTQTPDMVDQGSRPEQQQGEQRAQAEEQQGPDRADGPRQSDEPGRNVEQGRRPENATERVDRDATTEGDWGRLPPYARFLHSRGGAPDVPARYRRLYEAWQKRVNERERR